MSKEKKLNDYAQDRLDAYAGAENSLARLKAVQAANAPEKKKTPWGVYVRRIATSFSVLVVVVVGILFATQAFAGGKATDSAVSPDTIIANETAKNSVRPAYDSEVADNAENAEKGAAFAKADVNAETEYVRIVLPEDALIEKDITETGHYYTVSLSDGSFDAVISFGGAQPNDTAFTTDKESTVAGLPFSYAYDTTLRGKIVTDCETIYITHCAGDDETDALDAVRAVFTEK